MLEVLQLKCALTIQMEREQQRISGIAIQTTIQQQVHLSAELLQIAIHHHLLTQEQPITTLSLRLPVEDVQV